MDKSVNTCQIKIYLSGSIEQIKKSCREYCLTVGLCVTVTPTLFIYTGGEEYGVEIGLLNYPRFPTNQKALLKTATELANKCRNEAFQHSYLIVTPTKTTWHSTRK